MSEITSEERIREFDKLCAEEWAEEMKNGGAKLGVMDAAAALFHRALDGGDMIKPEDLLAAAELVKAGRATIYAGHDGELYLTPQFPAAPK